MDRYDYYEAVKKDAKEAAIEWLELNMIDLEDAPGHFYDVFDSLFFNDSVTGNCSGSYWFNTHKEEEAICHNLGLLGEALDDLGYIGGDLSAEACDVTIRCYLLGEVLTEVLEEILVDR